MRSQSQYWIGVVTLGLLLCASVHARHVVTLTDENFDELTADGKWLLEFFAPWCPHCQHLEPVYEEAAALIAATVPGVRFGAIDAEAATGLASRFDVSAYPTIKYYRKGLATEYEGGREVADFVQFAKLITGPSTMTLKSKEDVAALRQSPVSFVLLYKDSAELNKFKSLADKHQDLLRFGVTTDASLLPSELGETKSFGLVWFNDGKEEFYGADQEAFDEEAVEAWMLEHRYPHFVAFDSASWRALSTKKKTFVVGAFNPGPNVGSSKLYKILQQLSLEAEVGDHFVYGWLEAGRYANFIANYVGTSKAPTFFVIDVSNQIYWFNETIAKAPKKADVRDFLNDVHKGTIEGASATVGLWNKFARFLTSIFGSWLNETVLLAIICLMFVAVVILAVWFISASGGDDEAGENGGKPTAGGAAGGKVKTD